MLHRFSEMKTPEEYFSEQIFAPEQQGGESNSLEENFLRKFLGPYSSDRSQVNPEEQVAGPRETDPSAVVHPEVVHPDSHKIGRDPDKGPFISHDGQMEPAKQVVSPVSLEKFVGFEVGGQEFTISILEIKEVIKKCKVTRLPNAPSFMAGVASLRGKITPVLYMGDLLGVDESSALNFLVVCKYKDLQLGVLVEKISSMYKLASQDIDREFDIQFGENKIFSALLHFDDRLLPVISIEQIVRHVLQLE